MQKNVKTYGKTAHQYSSVCGMIHNTKKSGSGIFSSSYASIHFN